MAKIVTVDEMIQIEKAADASGHSYDKMMVHAGQSVADAIIDRVPDMAGKQVLVLAGTGNNGGDGLVAAKLLAEAGANIAIYQTKERPEDDPHLSALKELGILIVVGEQDQRHRVLNLQLERADILIDAVLGTGFSLPLRGNAQKVLKAVKRADPHAFVAAVDCPSGLDCDTGEIAEEALYADLTITLAAAKPGLFEFPGANYVGELVVGDIGLSQQQEELSSIMSEVATEQSVRPMLPSRPLDAHKGTFGQALIIAGSINYPGAAALAGRAAYLAGAGLVTMAVPSPVQDLVAGAIPECTWLPLGAELDGSSVDRLNLPKDRDQAVLIGPGFGLAPKVVEFISKLLGEEDSATFLSPVIFDADGLKLLRRLEGWQSRLPPGSILTPHPGEMSALTDLPTMEIQENRTALAIDKASEWGHIVVLKGAFTVIANSDGRSTLIPIATPALARAGTGDVLAGLMVGYLAQGLPSYEAAVLGSYIHAQAGLFAAEVVGTNASVLAGDVASSVPLAIAELEASMS